MNRQIKLKNATVKLIIMAVTLCCIPAASFAGSWNGWIYQDPYPTSVNLFDVKFVTPSKGWITGKYGTILYTQDGGDTWEAQESGTEEDLMRITFVNVKEGWVVGKQGSIMHTGDGGKTWTKQFNTNALLTKVFFVNGKDGWATGATPLGVVFRTRDGGKTWGKMDIGIDRAISSAYFFNTQIGWILAGEDVYRTADGGKKWEKSTLPVSMPSVGPQPLGGYPRPGSGPTSSMFGISRVEEGLGIEWWFGGLVFANEKKGWAAVSRWIFHTEDGGNTWAIQFDTGTMDHGLRHISFRDAQSGCATGWSIVCTEDGGKTWQERLGINPGEEKMLGGVSLTGTADGWTVGNSGRMLKTEDNGRSWKDALNQNECGPAHYFINEKIGWGWRYGLSSFNKFCKTIDGGRSWEKQEIGIKVKNILFADNLTGWAVGVIEEWKDGMETNYGPDRINVWGVIKHTIDGGKSWETQYKESMGEKSFGLVKISFLNNHTGWVIGDGGKILHTENGGKLWSQQKSGDAKTSLRKIHFVNTKEGWITGTQFGDRWTGMILHTDDGGNHWNVQYKQKDVGFRDIFFIDGKAGWVAGVTESDEAGILFSTKDGGTTWLKKDIEAIDLSSLTFLDKERGVIFSSSGMVLVTSDGGKTWNKRRAPLKKYPWNFSDFFIKTVNEIK